MLGNLINLKEFAQRTGLSEAYSRKMARENILPHYRPFGGKLIYFDWEEVYNILTRNKVKSKEQLEQEATDYLTIKNRK